MSAKPPKGSGATPNNVKANVVVKNEKKDHAASSTKPRIVVTPSPQSSGESINSIAISNKKRTLADDTTPDLTKFDDIGWYEVDEEGISATLRVHMIGDPYKTLKDGSHNTTKHLWVNATTADGELVKLKSFGTDTDRIYKTFKENEIVHFTNLKATKVHNPQLHSPCKLGFELRINKKSSVAGIRVQPSEIITENFIDLTQGTNGHIRVGILVPFAPNTTEIGNTLYMARVYDRHNHRAALYMHFDIIDNARRFENGISFVVKGFVDITEG
ncbi:hypothetical protein AAVH_11071 [Aphelenchoides avenae]|nr:hypothetical protein AAVH_11071 [Aphelenchus avenae]